MSDVAKRVAFDSRCPDCMGMVAGENGIPATFRCCWCHGTGFIKPQDDAEPVTAKWLQSIGFQEARSDLVGWTILLPPVRPSAAIVELAIRIGDPFDEEDRDVCVSLHQGVPDDPKVMDDHVLLTSLPLIPTRGDLRRLLAALGMEPTA